MSKNGFKSSVGFVHNRPVMNLAKKYLSGSELFSNALPSRSGHLSRCKNWGGECLNGLLDTNFRHHMKMPVLNLHCKNYFGISNECEAQNCQTASFMFSLKKLNLPSKM